MKLSAVSSTQEWGYKETLSTIAPNQSIPNASNADVAMGTYVMPFAGKLVIEGFARCSWNADSQLALAGLQSSTPAPSPYSYSTVWQGQPPAYKFVTEIPFVAQWDSLASGATITLRCRVEAGGGGSAVKVEAIGWFARASQ